MTAGRTPIIDDDAVAAAVAIEDSSAPRRRPAPGYARARVQT
jgi:hypothetical protein